MSFYCVLFRFPQLIKMGRCVCAICAFAAINMKLNGNTNRADIMLTFQRTYRKCLLFIFRFYSTRFTKGI